MLEIDYDAELQKMLWALEEAKRETLNVVTPKEAKKAKKLSELKLDAVGQKIVTVPIEEGDFEDDVLVPGLKTPKKEPQKENKLKIEVATTIEEKEKPIDMLHSLNNLKNQFQECEIQECEEEIVKEKSIDALFDQLDQLKDEVSTIAVKPALVIKPDEPIKKTRSVKDIPIALKLQETITGEKVEPPQREIIHERKAEPKPIEMKIIKPSPPVISSQEQIPEVKLDLPEIEIAPIDEVIFIAKASKELKEIIYDEDLTLENAKKIVEILKNGPQTLYSISEMTDLVEFELYQAIEFLKKNELLDISRSGAEDLLSFPEISEKRWEKYITVKKEVVEVKPKKIYEDPESIYTGLQPHCPNCKKIIEIREIKLLFKGYEPECPACRHILKSTDIGL
ncbi:MAG: hypothetical protein ACTSVY_12805 [Candidatus Helarchaeota archaeon]